MSNIMMHRHKRLERILTPGYSPHRGVGVPPVAIEAFLEAVAGLRLLDKEAGLQNTRSYSWILDMISEVRNCYNIIRIEKLAWYQGVQMNIEPTTEQRSMVAIPCESNRAQWFAGALIEYEETGNEGSQIGLCRIGGGPVDVTPDTSVFNLLDIRATDLYRLPVDALVSYKGDEPTFGQIGKINIMEDEVNERMD